MVNNLIFMKRIIIITCLFVLGAFQANAQFHFGGDFNVRFVKQHTDFTQQTNVDDKELAFMVNLKPKVYWNIGDKMQVGSRIGFAFGRLTNGTIYDEKKPEQPNFVNRAIGWSLTPFFGYRLFSWKFLSAWAEGNAFIGQYYNMKKPGKDSQEWQNQLEYGFQIIPVVNFDLTEKLALQVHLGILSLGWYGTRSKYNDKVVTTTDWDFHKGGFSGILQGLTDYGVGLVRKF